MKVMLPFLLAFTLMDCGHVLDKPIPEASIVVYYAGTEEEVDAIAREIADQTGADIFEIEAEMVSYQTWKLKQAVPPGFSDYGTVYFGYETWSPKPAQPALLFLEENNLDNKRWYPFTVASQEVADETLHWLDSDGWRENWHEPKGFEKDADPAAVSVWLNSMEN